MARYKMQSRLSSANGAYTTEMVQEYPLASMLLLFSVGVGVGVVLGQTVCDSMLRAFEREATTSERLGRQFRHLWEGAVPEAVARHLRS